MSDCMVCVACGAPLVEESGTMICTKCAALCHKTHEVNGIHMPPPNNTFLSFNGGIDEADFIVSYRRAKPLNKFQIWMYKICFGIHAKSN